MPVDTAPAGPPANLCLFVESERVGGTELAMAALLRSLDTERWRPVLVHHGAPEMRRLVDDLATAGVRDVVVAPLPEGLRGTTAIPPLVRTLRQLRPRIFHARLTSPNGCKWALAAAVAARVPAVVASVHAFPERGMTRPALAQRRLLARAVTRYAVPSAHGRRTLNAMIPATRGRTTVIHNGVELGRYDRAVDPDLRARVTAGGRRAAVLVPARLDERKGHRFLFAAVRDLADVQLVVAGTGPHRAALERLAGALGIAERVDFVGFWDDMPQLYAACDVVALPTLNEAFGNAVLEGMAARRPVIATRVGGPEEIVVDRVSGLLVAPGDAAALRSALCALREDPAQARRLADGGRRRAEERFTIERCAERWSGLYREVTETAGGRGGHGQRRNQRFSRRSNSSAVQSPTPTRGSSNGSLERDSARSQTAAADV
jgi:glycosyltransferase involved in cell wall biosynthesis